MKPNFTILALSLYAAAQAAATFSEPPADSLPTPDLLTAAVRAAIAPRPATNGQVMLTWTAGTGQQTLVNLSNQTAMTVGPADLASVRGLTVDSTNTFVITNIFGASNLATGVATRGTNRISLVGSIQIYSVPLTPGRTNWLLTSSNLVTWWRRQNLGTNAGIFTFAVTNSGGPPQFFQTLAE